jgi:hypothetical protein
VPTHVPHGPTSATPKNTQAEPSAATRTTAVQGGVRGRRQQHGGSGGKSGALRREHEPAAVDGVGHDAGRHLQDQRGEGRREGRPTRELRRMEEGQGDQRVRDADAGRADQ